MAEQTPKTMAGGMPWIPAAEHATSAIPFAERQKQRMAAVGPQTRVRVAVEPRAPRYGRAIYQFDSKDLKNES